jgi:DNA polymerase type B, organellar and viral
VGAKDKIELENKDNLILIQFKIKLLNNSYRSISYLQTVNFNDLNDLIDIFIEFWSLRDEDYISLNPSHIVYTYKIINDHNNIITTKINRSKSIKSSDFIKFKGFNLPNTMDFLEWGKVIFKKDTFALVSKINSKFKYHINIFDNYLSTSLKYKDKSILEFTDTIIEKGKLNSFTRKVKNHEYIFIDGKLVLKKIHKKVKFIKKIIPQSFISKNFVTIDLETRKIDGILTPYCVSIYEGKKVISFYLADFNNPDDMLKLSLKYLMRPKYHNYKIYIHNFSFFDAIFLIRIFSELTDMPIKPIMRDGRIIDLKFSFDFNGTNFNLFFRDSYLLLPSSLRKLAINFNVENKGIFPYSFVNLNNISLDYIGRVPSYQYFTNLKMIDYIKYYKSFNHDKWSLRNETIKYCEQDCKTLYQIIRSFQKKIFILFRLDILKYPTLSSLAFAIFRYKFI